MTHTPPKHPVFGWGVFLYKHQLPYLIFKLLSPQNYELVYKKDQFTQYCKVY